MTVTHPFFRGMPLAHDLNVSVNFLAAYAPLLTSFQNRRFPIRLAEMREGTFTRSHIVKNDFDIPQPRGACLVRIKQQYAFFRANRLL